MEKVQGWYHHIIQLDWQELGKEWKEMKDKLASDDASTGIGVGTGSAPSARRQVLG